MTSFGLYVHIPFCASACPYCDFAFVAGRQGMVDRYVEALITELEERLAALGPDPTFQTVYFGGGTPSAIPVDRVEKIIDAVRHRATVVPDAEITLEANPGDRPSFARFEKIGVNRLSLGVQALDDRALRALGRNHTTADAIAGLRAARDAGFRNVNIDLIFGAPGQTLREWQTTLETAIRLGPEHLSIYGLTIEPGTPFWRRRQKGRLSLPSEESQAECYERTLERLSEVGYVQYEISNFARPGFSSRHNLACWDRQPYLGVGMSAHSFLYGRRSWNIRELSAYLEAVESSGTAIADTEVITDANRRLETVMLGLRQRRGVARALLRESPRFDRLLSQRLLELDGPNARLTRRGLLLADAVSLELVRDA